MLLNFRGTEFFTALDTPSLERDARKHAQLSGAPLHMPFLLVAVQLGYPRTTKKVVLQLQQSATGGHKA